MQIPRLSDLTNTAEQAGRSRFYTDMGICRSLTTSPDGLISMLEQRWGERSPHLALIKTNVPAMTTDGFPDSQVLGRAFLVSVGRAGYAFESIPFVRVPPDIEVAIEQQAGVATRIEEGRAIAVAAGDLTTARVRLGDVATIRIYTKEAARNPGMTRYIEAAQVRDIGSGVDAAAFDPTDANSLTFGTAITATGDVAADVEDLLAAISDGVPARPYLVFGAAAAREVVFHGGDAFAGVQLVGAGNLHGIPTISTPAPALAGLVIALDVSAIFISDEGITTDRAEAAALQMADDPTNASADGSSPAQSVATTIVALWQSNSIGLRSIRHVGWAKRANAVAYLDLSGSPA